MSAIIEHIDISLFTNKVIDATFIYPEKLGRNRKQVLRIINDTVVWVCSEMSANSILSSLYSVPDRLNIEGHLHRHLSVVLETIMAYGEVYPNALLALRAVFAELYEIIFFVVDKNFRLGSLILLIYTPGSVVFKRFDDIDDNVIIIDWNNVRKGLYEMDASYDVKLYEILNFLCSKYTNDKMLDALRKAKSE